MHLIHARHILLLKYSIPYLSKVTIWRSMMESAINSRRPNILVTNNSINVERLREIGNVVVNPKSGVMDRRLLLEMARDVDAVLCLLTDKIDEEFLNCARNIKVIGTMSVGYEHIDVKACKERRIGICNTPGVLTETVAELTIALLLATCRRLPEAISEAKSGGWEEWKPYWLCGKDIRGSTIGIFGMGRIGCSVAEKLRVFQPQRIVYASRSPKSLAYEYVSFDDLLKQSDIVIICASSNPETVDLFNEQNLRKMKKDSILINTSRGNLVVMDDLAKILSEGHLFAAGLDVTVPEPLGTDHKLFQLKRCVVLPHIGSASISTRDAMANMAIDGIIAGLKGEISDGMKEFLDD
uniref:Glyoxylate reductase/hydroxypyruvate reductase n=1 Tax=Steinernema glaseri TaxID=37863 RepID=A0A1I8ABS8_9BILA